MFVFFCLFLPASGLRGPPRAHNIFSGIVEEVGTICDVWRDSFGRVSSVAVAAEKATSDANTGCSISVNGVCLTVTKFNKTAGQFEADVGPETERLTNIGRATGGEKVNLERALPVNGRNGGHNVQGHVEAEVVLIGKEEDGRGVSLTFAAPDEAMQHLVKRGFVALDGVSLTTTDIDFERSTFSVMLVPETLRSTTFWQWHIGHRANFESDPIARHVRRSVSDFLRLLHKADD